MRTYNIEKAFSNLFVSIFQLVLIVVGLILVIDIVGIYPKEEIKCLFFKCTIEKSLITYEKAPKKEIIYEPIIIKK